MDFSLVIDHTSTNSTFVPVAFENAWCHIVMGFVLLAERELLPACKHLLAAVRMVDRGNIEMADHYRLVNLRTSEKCPSIVMTTLCVDQLVRAPVAKGKDMVSLYEEAIQAMVRQAGRYWDGAMLTQPSIPPWISSRFCERIRTPYGH